MADTIFAQATAPGRAGIAVIRISGTRALEAAAMLAPGRLAPRRATLRRLRDPADGTIIDEALLLHFPAPQSFTGESVLEIQCHGSPAVTARILSLLGGCSGLRPAEPGEFTRRALENGRLDLAQVEGLAELLAAETEAQRRQAVFVASGHASRLAEGWRDRLVAALAHVEASIDFADDGVDVAVLRPVPEAVAGVAHEIRNLLAGSAGAERVRDGFTVALCGAPNVGKSTLLNALAGRDVALTSPIAGTTRDVLEVRLDLAGLPVTLLDTAGLRETDDPLEAMGVERAQARAAEADLRVFLSDGCSHEYETQLQAGDLLVWSKADLRPVATGLAVSAVTGEGIEALLARISATLSARVGNAVGLASRRQQAALSDAAAWAEEAVGLLSGMVGREELAADALRQALRGLDCLVGRVDVETVLDVVFRDFCLGK